MFIKKDLKRMPYDLIRDIMYEVESKCKDIDDLEHEVTLILSVKDVFLIIKYLGEQKERYYTKINAELKDSLIESIVDIASTNHDLASYLTEYLYGYDNQTNTFIDLCAQEEKQSS